MIVGNFEGLGSIEAETLVESLDVLANYRAHGGGYGKLHIVEPVMDGGKNGDFKFGITQEGNRFEISPYLRAEGLEIEGFRSPEVRVFPEEDGKYIFLANSITLDLRFIGHPRRGEIYAYPLGMAEGGNCFDDLRCRIGRMSVINVYPIEELPELVIPDTVGPHFVPPHSSEPLLEPGAMYTPPATDPIDRHCF